MEELEKNEYTIVQEAEQLRVALQTTVSPARSTGMTLHHCDSRSVQMGMLGRLQSDIEDHNVKHLKSLEEREQMLERVSC